LQLTDSRSRPAENTARSIESAGPSAATTPAAPGTAGGHDVAGASRPDRRSAADLPPAADRDVALAAKPKAKAQGPTIVDALRIAIALRDQQSDARAGRPRRRLDEV
ncbi:MAG: hypothetical protein JNJ48_01640, partial [Phycisphaerae bacterium]|nr:hypothetical protein [Phycisphaerae bacterium]